MRACLFVLLFVCAALAETDPAFYALKVTATTSKTPTPRITLNWPTETCTSSYDCQHFTIHKAVYNADSLSAQPTLTQIAQVSKTTTSYVDTNVVVGTRYVYQLVRQNVAGFSPNTPENTLLAGIEVPVIDYFGKVIFVVETAVVTSLSTLLAQVEEDMIGDGWGVVRVVVDRTYTVAQTKTLIRQAYQANPDAKALYIFGSVPVTYSGVLAPDGHNDHRGAWPTDMYYADAVENNVWTDTTSNIVHSSIPRLSNVPGDGKFDQATLPANYVQELQVGRVDMTGITLLPNENEISLLQKYFIKSHNFKHGLSSYRRKALIRDSFGERNGEAFAQNGWKPFNVILGNQNVVKYLDNTIPEALKNASVDDYLFFYGCGGGNPEWMDGTGHIHDYLYWQPKLPFTMLFGSYFGDWAYDNVLLKAPIVGAHGLTSVWGARPNWIFYHLGLGFNVGRSTWASQSLRRQIHMTLLGDPTIRPFVVAPPSNLRATRSGDSVTLTWSASPASGVLGYHVYSAFHKYSPFTRHTTTLITSLSFTHSLPSTSSAVYMVRAVKLDSTASGSFFNPSQGIFVTVGNPTVPPTTKPTPPPTQAPTPAPTPAPTTNPLCGLLGLFCP